VLSLLLEIQEYDSASCLILENERYELYPTEKFHTMVVYEIVHRVVYSFFAMPKDTVHLKIHTV
jgi:hypothetical protein